MKRTIRATMGLSLASPNICGHWQRRKASTCSWCESLHAMSPCVERLMPLLSSGLRWLEMGACSELTVSDAGDHHDGSGLVSSSAQSAARADEVFAMLPYDVLAIGNHELYKYESAKELYEHKERW